MAIAEAKGVGGHERGARGEGTRPCHLLLRFLLLFLPPPPHQLCVRGIGMRRRRREERRGRGRRCLKVSEWLERREGGMERFPLIHNDKQINEELNFLPPLPSSPSASLPPSRRRDGGRGRGRLSCQAAGGGRGGRGGGRGGERGRERREGRASARELGREEEGREEGNGGDQDNRNVHLKQHTTDC